MKIYFVGSHSSGKSTLSRYVSEKYKVPMITEVARSILAERELSLDSLRVNLDLVDEFQSDIFYRQIKEETKYNNFVSDRSYDCLAYAAQHSRVFNEIINSNELKDYIETLSKPDVCIFFVRPSKQTLKEDGVRESLNWDHMVSINTIIKFVMDMYEIPYIQIDSPNLKERIKIIESILCLKNN